MRVFRGFFWLKNVVALAIYIYFDFIADKAQYYMPSGSINFIYIHANVHVFFLEEREYMLIFLTGCGRKLYRILICSWFFSFCFLFFYVNSFKFGADEYTEAIWFIWFSEKYAYSSFNICWGMIKINDWKKKCIIKILYFWIKYKSNLNMKNVGRKLCE